MTYLGPMPASPSGPSPVGATSPATLITGVEVHLPERVVDVRSAELELARRNPGIVPKTPMVTRLTGVRQVHVMPDDWDASDLAVAAASKLLAAQGLSPRDIDLMIFASASQDMVEPATSHIVAHKLGLTAPVMDVKNACNSVLNGIEVADALIASGRYSTVLVACGEAPSRGVRWDVPDRDTYFLSAPGYSMSDAGAAVLLRRAGRHDATAVDPQGNPAPRGILASAFTADSTHWDVGMLPGGGTAYPRDVERSYFEIDGRRLREAFLALGPDVVLRAMAEAGIGWDDVALVAVHQVALIYLDDVLDVLGLPRNRTVVVIDEHGNTASASLPLQLAKALESNRVGPGDVVVLVGLAGGISLGAMVVRL